MKALPRRAALLLPLGTAGCGLFDNVFSPIKPTISGTREAVSPVRRGLEIAAGKGGMATVPPPTAIADWPQAGGNAAHVPGHPSVGPLNTAVWTAKIGAGTEYRQRITSSPVVASGRVVAMDANGVVSAFDLADGRRLWRTVTRPKMNRSTNVGGGVAASGTRVWAATGRAEMLALDAATGNVLWRQPLGAPARSAPTVADGHLYVTTLENKLLSFAADTGKPGWTYQAATVQTTLLGDGNPAVADGFVVAGFGSGDLIAIRADSGALAWSDNLSSARGQTSLVDLSAVTAAPLIANGRVFAIAAGGVFACDDLRSGRRLWEREVGGSQTPWIAGNSLFVVTGEQALAALDSRDGQPIWVDELERYHDTKDQSGPVHWVGPVLAGNQLVVASSDSQVAGFRPANGKLVGSTRLPAPISLRPIAAAGFLLVLDDEGTIRAFR